MTQKNAARERLARLENKYFQGISLTETALLKTEEERRPFVLAQVERLLTEKMGEVPLGDSLWDDYNSPKHYKTLLVLTPLHEMPGVETMTDEELARINLIRSIEELCWRLYKYCMHDRVDNIGIPGRLWISNKELLEWLTTTPYEHIAMYIAYELKRRAKFRFFAIQYQPAQDKVAEIFSEEYKKLIREPDNTEIPPRAYVKAILDTLQSIDQHWECGRRMKLNPEVVKLHDDIFGFIPQSFDKEVIEAAQAIYDYMDENVRGRFFYRGYPVWWNRMTLSFRNKCEGVMRRTSQRVRELRDQYLAKGWLEDNSLAFAYVLAQAEHIARQKTLEEDYAL